uniref:Uncharacterized protein n=1 Tax=Arundo donax TaxID=35708 RepID=A0A0A9GRZ6_ARUDO
MHNTGTETFQGWISFNPRNGCPNTLSGYQ